MTMDSSSLFLDRSGNVRGVDSRVIIQPVVLFSVLDHHTRRTSDQSRVIGTLLGSIVDGVIEVRASFPVPHSEDDTQVAVDMDYMRTYFELHNRVSPRDSVVGWYATGSKVSDHSELIQQFFAGEFPHAVHVLVDTDIDEAKGIKASAFKCDKDTLVRPLGPHFSEIPLSIASEDADRAAVAALVRSCVADIVPSMVSASASASENNATMTPELDQLESSLEMVRSRISSISEYVSKVRSGDIKGDPEVGRRLAMAVSEVPKVEPAEFDAALSSSTQDLLMVVFLSDLIKTQLGISEKLETLL